MCVWLLGTLSPFPHQILYFTIIHTVLTIGAFKENLRCVSCTWDSGAIFSFRIYAAKRIPAVEKCKLNVSASSVSVFTTFLFLSEILFTDFLDDLEPN